MYMLQNGVGIYNFVLWQCLDNSCNLHWNVIQLGELYKYGHLLELICKTKNLHICTTVFFFLSNYANVQYTNAQFLLVQIYDDDIVCVQLTSILPV